MSLALADVHENKTSLSLPSGHFVQLLPGNELTFLLLVSGVPPDADVIRGIGGVSRYQEAARRGQIKVLHNFNAPQHRSRSRSNLCGHCVQPALVIAEQDRKSTRLNSSHGSISYAVFCLKKK